MACKYQPGIRRCVGVLAAVCAAMAALAAPECAYGVIEVNVTRVGFPTLQAGEVVRSGAWVPIIVDLSLIEQQSFDGYVRLGQFDNDGDECYDSVDVHLRAETGGAQRVHLYALANPHQRRFVIELFSDDDEAVQVLCQGELTYQAEPARQPPTILDDTILILSLSSGAIGRVQELVASDQADLYTRPIHVAHMSPTDLPELWIGLETVDYIVWDDARPEELTERQIDALLEWVRQGGTLLLAGSRTAGSLKLAKSIDAALPVDLGEVVPVDNLPNVRQALLSARKERRRRGEEDDAWWDTPFPAPVPVVQCTLREGALRIPDNRYNQSNVVTRRQVGRGFVIFSAVTLKDLLGAGGSAVDFFRELFHLAVSDESELGRPDLKTLFPYVVSAVGFVRSGSLYLLIAGVFSVAYVLLATSGTWALLGARGRRHHSWSAFAIVGVAASILSVLAVNSVRGFGETLHQISILDAEAGEAYGYGTAFFGVKTGTDRELDFWLPSDPLGATEPGRTNCFLRPVPVGTDPGEASSSFADPEEYRLLPANAVVDDVRIRATLKRFEGRWAGSLGGMVTGEVTIEGSRIVEGSYIVNNLGVELTDCYLLQTALDMTGTAALRSTAIYAYPIGTVPSGNGRFNLTPGDTREEGEEPDTEATTRPTLKDAQKRWGSKFHSILSGGGYTWGSGGDLMLGQEKNALLLLSTVGEHDPYQEAGLFGVASYSRDRLRQLDMREHLRRDTMILIGFADDPGPIRLFRRTGDGDYRVLHPDTDRSWTMYRIRIPVTVLKEPERDEYDQEIEKRIQ